MPLLPIILALLFLPSALSAQTHQHDPTAASPYSTFMDREIRALSADEISGLLGGMGLEMALPAELNGYPGPRHVIDLADMLALTEEQRVETAEIFETMAAEAKAIGAEIVELERELDSAFRTGTITEPALTDMVRRIAERRGELRLVHLRTHLVVRPMLTEEQRAHYDRARGYSGDTRPPAT